MNDNRAEARMNDVRSLVVARLELVSRATVCSLRTSDGADQSDVVHLLGEFREDFADLDA